MSPLAHILVADDDPAIITSLRLLLENSGFKVSHANHPHEVTLLLDKHSVDLVLLDMNYSRDTTSGGEGLELLETLHADYPSLPLVVMTGWATIDLAVASMQKGARDFIKKPWDNPRLLNIIKTQVALAQAQQDTRLLSRENEILKDNLALDKMPLIAESVSMQRLVEMASQAAKTDATLLITGENGTGKSMLAEYVHSTSARHQNPFVSINMGAIPETLFESEMFGHVKGAFTDARTNRIGRVELAEQGTLFLDEVGNVPLEQQAKLLRLLEQRRYEAVGSSRTQDANVRVIAATNANLQAMVDDKTFRIDLLYRLNTIVLELPPLRERVADIVPMAEAFCRHHLAAYGKGPMALTDNAKQALTNYHWPGNVRELSHVIERAVIFAGGQDINADQLMLQDKSADLSKDNGDSGGTIGTLEQIEKQAILERLAACSGNANQAADSLGLSRSAFYRRLDKYKL